MWNERSLFVLSALFAIFVWIVIAKRQSAIKSGKNPVIVNRLTALAIAVPIIILLGNAVNSWRLSGYSWSPSSIIFPGWGSFLAILIGGAVGSFSARFVWGLFGADFGAKSPLAGVLTLLLLVIVYSFPVYHNEWTALLDHIGLTSIKTPLAEFTFTSPTAIKGAINSASASGNGSGTDVHSSAIPSPNDPRAALGQLASVVPSLLKDDGYIAFFKGNPINPIPTELSDEDLKKTQQYLHPVGNLAFCLQQYVEIFPDSHLLLVDIKPIVQWAYRTHAIIDKGLIRANGALDNITPRDESNAYGQAILDVRNNILIALGSTKSKDINDTEIKTLLAQYSNDEKLIADFTDKCGEGLDKLLANPLTPPTPLQPYGTIMLAGLLNAHGSSDAAIRVLLDWLDWWKCVRYEKERPKECKIHAIKNMASNVPEWFSIRAEFELSVLLYNAVGEEKNIAYLQFLTNVADHFTNFAASSPVSVSIPGELHRCLNPDKTKVEGEDVKSNRLAILRSLLQNENTLLRSRLHFLTNRDWIEMESFIDRARVLTRFSVDCIWSEAKRKDDKQQNDKQNDTKAREEADRQKVQKEFWEATLYDYKITFGLLALGVADRLTTINPSADQHNLAAELSKEGARQLREGYRKLADYRKNDRLDIEGMLWADRVFRASSWENSMSVAEAAIDQLNKSGR